MDRPLIVAAIGIVSAVTSAQAQFFAIDSYTVDVGGGTSTGGGGGGGDGFTLSGTIGQPDAGTVTMTGGGFALAGGFWAAAAAPCPCEFDNAPAQINVFDLLAYLDLWFALHPGAELDGQPSIDVFDLLAFLDCWFPSSAGAPCP